MTRLEMVEKIREKTGVTYDTAREALENNDWDLLDALISLDKMDFSEAQNAGDKVREGTVENSTRVKHKGMSSETNEKVNSVIRWIFALIRKGENVRINISKKDEQIESVSITVVILLFLLKWWLPVGLAVLGWICNYKFRISGEGTSARILNNLGNKAEKKAEEIKESFSSKE